MLIKSVTGAIVVLLVYTGPLAGSQNDAPGTVIPGETLDPASHGPAVIERMDVVLERDRTKPADQVSEGSGRNGRQGRWVIPSRNATFYPRSGQHNVVNEWGDTRMGIGFPGLVDVECAYFSGQAAEGAWTTGLRVLGYRNGQEVAATEWFTGLGREAALFQIDLRGVDRIEIQSTPRVQGGGWYAMDDLAYTVRSESTGGAPRTFVLDFEDCDYKQALTGSGYAGLIWETGSGEFNADPGIPSPQTLPEDELEVAPAPPEEAGPRGVATTPALLSSFQGVIRGDAGSFSYPPDTCGAIGPNHFVETVNRNFAVYLKSNGTRITNTTLGAFLPGSNGDPRVLYDQYSGRWVIIVSDFSSRIYLAVSATSDPTGLWFKTFIDVAQGSDAGCWPDYPTLGVNADGIYTASYMVGCGMSLFAIDKAPLVAPSPSLGTITAFRNLPFEGAIQPAHTYGAEGAEYIVSRASSNLRIRRLTGPMTAPTLVDLGLVTIPSHAFPNDVPALGSTTNLDSVDARLMNAVYRDGSIWTAHTIDLSGRAACRWYEADVSAMVLNQYGTISDPVRHYFFPAISVNFRGDAVMGFSGSSAGQYAAAYYTGRLAVDPPGAMAPPVLLRAGSASQNNIDGFGRNRWGDYSLTSVDPTNERLFWTIQEYAHSTDIWGTYVGQIGYPDCNNNGVDDAQDIAAGTSPDCNGNVLPDECELVGNDCNTNQTPDDCEIAAGTSIDCDADGTPDQCEPDCNSNAVADDCDLSSGASDDCQANGVPDECEIAAGSSVDCTANGVPDECETDCNLNRIRDDCDIASGASGDCNANAAPDECDIAARLSLDCNASGVPDECELTAGTSGDCNTNGIPDECDSEVCFSAWNGFETDPPFALGALVEGIDFDADGVAWQNSSGSTSIGGVGCPAGQGRAMKAVGQTPPTTDSVTSEFFRTVGGTLDNGASIWSLSFDARSEAFLNPRIDWQLSIRDGTNDQPAILLHWAATHSNFAGVAAVNGRGKVLIQNPAGSPAFINTGYTLTANSCYNIRVVLNNVTDVVQVFINGVLRATTTRLHASANRLDYFHLEQHANGQASGNPTRLAIDNVTVCLTGATIGPGGLLDCNENGVLDDCDLSDGTSTDANANGIPDDCEGAPAAAVTGAVTRKGCDLALLPGVRSEPRVGGVTEVRIAFNVPPGDPPGSDPGVTIQEKSCAAPGTYVPYSGASAATASVGGNELLVSFVPGLENGRTYRLDIGADVTSAPGQFVEVRGLLGDVDGDGLVLATDRSAVVGVWSGAGFSCATDVDTSGATNAVDRSLVVGAWTGPQNCAP